MTYLTQSVAFGIKANEICQESTLWICNPSGFSCLQDCRCGDSRVGTETGRKAHIGLDRNGREGRRQEQNEKDGTETPHKRSCLWCLSRFRPVSASCPFCASRFSSCFYHDLVQFMYPPPVLLFASVCLIWLCRQFAGGLEDGARF